MKKHLPAILVASILVVAGLAVWQDELRDGRTACHAQEEVFGASHTPSSFARRKPEIGSASSSPTDPKTPG